ncbi:hypothetical protein [Xanthomonas hortorum]|nr:hypothetical protein [Xanthomonas hortorum]
MIELPAQALVALATITATLITSLIGLVSLTLSKELKVSEMRRDWIESLRTELSEYFQAMRHLARASDELATSEPGKAGFKRTKLEEAIITGNLSFYKIQLRLNSTKPLHSNLLKSLGDIENCYSSWPDSSDGCGEEIIKKITYSNSCARDLIDQEWKRVKIGEPAYNRLRRWIVPGSLLIIAIFIAAALFVSYK